MTIAFSFNLQTTKEDDFHCQLSAGLTVKLTTGLNALQIDP